MRKVVIIPNIEKDKKLIHTKKVIEILNKYSVEILLYKDIAELINFNCNTYFDNDLCTDVDLAIVLGGDGTLLNAVRQTICKSIPILGINLGRLGFLTELEISNLDQSFEKLFRGEYKIDRRIMLEANLIRDGKKVDSFNALNDIGVTRGALSRIISLKVYVNNDFIDYYSADGIIISTPTGSTAYSLSAGGPIVDPNMNLFIITPICPHTLHSRSIIVPEDKVIRVHIEDIHHHDTIITVDGQQGYKLQPRDIILVKKSPYIAQLVRINENSFYDVLRKKLTERGGKHS